MPAFKVSITKELSVPAVDARAALDLAERILSNEALSAAEKDLKPTLVTAAASVTKN